MANYKGEDREEFHKTTTYLMELMSEILEENFDINNITEFLENSAGDGDMMDYLINKYNKPVIGYDIIQWCGYSFFKKDFYNKDDINLWINFIGGFGGLMYITKPLPPIALMKKIKIIE